MLDKDRINGQFDGPGAQPLAQRSGRVDPRGPQQDHLSGQELTVLERLVRRQVSGLVGSQHPDPVRRYGRVWTGPTLADRRRPEQVRRPLSVPGAAAAVAFRERFLAALLDPDIRHHRDLVDELVRSRVPLPALAIFLISPLAAELGVQWCEDDADFMQVAVASTRLATVVTHLAHAAAQVTPRPAARRVLLARSAGTRHTLGITLVRVCLLDMGWNVDGDADVEMGDDLFMRLAMRPYDVIGLSIGALDEVADCRSTLTRCRSLVPRTLTAIGGAAVVSAADQFETVGADLVARCPEDLLQVFSPSLA
ncbi:cobalamin-binding protein [Microvirga tunisiensis]|uniref:Cobalamin-binding protein n=1 Tax=Pannonibacter tanglangensis TaxID=2750084 RepID=A0A7X5EYX9_9HYPH|nr:cobalamin-dependent protein [Pannonibacter sp. XCT-53]NBN76661.1 cobalamin-binding protein [Pannonibacter sp. XCT-53]